MRLFVARRSGRGVPIAALAVAGCGPLAASVPVAPQPDIAVAQRAAAASLTTSVSAQQVATTSASTSTQPPTPAAPAFSATSASLAPSTPSAPSAASIPSAPSAPSLPSTTLAPSAFIHTVRYISQTLNNCRPASVAEVLGYWGIDRSQGQVQAVLRADGNSRGMAPFGIPGYAKDLGMRALLGVEANQVLVKALVSNG